MNFALFGFDPVFVELTRALRSHEHHSLRWACDAGPLQRELAAHNREVAFRESWHDLAGEAAIDAVLLAPRHRTKVAQNDDTSATGSEDPARRLAQAGKHLLLARPETLPLMTLYELAMISEETGAVIMPIQWEQLHPAFKNLGSSHVPSPDGRLRHVAFRRSIPPGSLSIAGRQPESRGGLSSGAFEPITEADRRLREHFARDALLLRYLTGDFTHVTGLFAPKPRETDRTPAPTNEVAVCVSVVGAHGNLSTWTCVSTLAHAPRVQLTLTTDTSVTRLQWTDLRRGLRRSITSAAGRSMKQFGPWNPAEAILNRFRAATEAKTLASDLFDATRCSELTESAVRSLRRGRSVALRHEEQTEASTFKGAMTSVGCGLLGVVLFALMITAAAEGLGLGWVRYAWYGIVPLLVVFLILQLFALVYPRSESPNSHRGG